MWVEGFHKVIHCVVGEVVDKFGCGYIVSRTSDDVR